MNPVAFKLLFGSFVPTLIATQCWQMVLRVFRLLKLGSQILSAKSNPVWQGLKIRVHRFKVSTLDKECVLAEKGFQSKRSSLKKGGSKVCSLEWKSISGMSF
jgi:hypothetical protein